VPARRPHRREPRRRRVHGLHARQARPDHEHVSGTLRVAEADERARRSVIEASARDTRGQGAAAATITSTLEPDGEGTRVAVRRT